MLGSKSLLFLVSTTAIIRGFGFTPRTISTTKKPIPCRRPATGSFASSMSSNSMVSSSPKGVAGLYLFDFDGVVCDSCDECTVSALRTCQQLGVDKMDNHSDLLPEYPPKWLFDKMREIRPAIETGWQIPVLLYVFLDQHRQAFKQGGPKAMSVSEIIENYEELVAKALATWGKTETDMIDAFGGVRDAWIKDDLSSWLDINSFYPGVPEALSDCKGEGVLVTTKQQRFAIALCRHAGVGPESLPDDRIYGLGQYQKKADVIADRMASGGYAPAETYFFEDRWPTLAKCLNDERLDGVNLNLCSWGYCTESELTLAKAEPRVQVLELKDFVEMVKAQGTSA